MGFWTAVIIIVSIMAGSSMITGIVSAIKPKIKKQDLDELKSQILRELGGGEHADALPDHRTVRSRLDELEEKVGMQETEIRELSEENTFLRRLLEK